MCKVALLYYDLNQYAEGYRYFEQHLRLSDYEYMHTNYYHTTFSYGNVYKILILQKYSLELFKTIKFPNYRSYWSTSSYLGLLFFIDDKSYFCVSPIWNKSFHFLVMQCKKLHTNIVHLFKNSMYIPDLWYLMTLEDMELFVGSPKGTDVTKLPFVSNPFAKIGQNLVYEHLLQVIFLKANTSLSYFTKNSSAPHAGDIYLQGWNTYSYFGQQQIVLLKFQNFQFITCYSEQFISMSFFLSPFQPVVWGMLLTSVLIILLVVYLY